MRQIVRPHSLEGALFLVICSDIMGDTTLAWGDNTRQAI